MTDESAITRSQRSSHPVLWLQPPPPFTCPLPLGASGLPVPSPDIIIQPQAPEPFSLPFPVFTTPPPPSPPVNIPGLLARLSRIRIMAASNNSPRSCCAATIPNGKKMPNATSPQSFFRSYHCKPTNKLSITNSSNPETRQTVRKYSYNNLPGVTGGPPPSTPGHGHTSWQYGAPTHPG